MSRRSLLAVVGLACLFAAESAARQTVDMAIDGQVSQPAGSGGIAGVSITVFGPMEGKAAAAIKSFPLMAAEISETLSIPGVATTSDDEGKFRVSVPRTGLYSVLATRTGYVGPPTPGQPPTSVLVTATVDVRANERAEVLLYMMPGESRPKPPGQQRQP